RLDALREPDVENVRVMTMTHRPPICEPWSTPLRSTLSPVDDAAQRLHQEDHIVTQLRRDSRVLDPGTPLILRDRTAVRIEQALQNREPDLRSVVEVDVRHELRLGFAPGQPQRTDGGLYRVRDSSGVLSRRHPVEDVLSLAS